MKRDLMSEIFNDPSNLDILNKSLLSQQATLKNYLNLDLTRILNDEDRDRIESSIKKIDDILDMIEEYSASKTMEKIPSQGQD
jgi:hypothetical protein